MLHMLFYLLLMPFLPLSFHNTNMDLNTSIIIHDPHKVTVLNQLAVEIASD
jgi:hypothetical protein